MEVLDMGMTNKQFQGFIMLLLDKALRALEGNQDNEQLQELISILQSMLEDD